MIKVMCSALFILPLTTARGHGGLISDYVENPFKVDSSPSFFHGSHLLL